MGNSRQSFPISIGRPPDGTLAKVDRKKAIIHWNTRLAQNDVHFGARGQLWIDLNCIQSSRTATLRWSAVKFIQITVSCCLSHVKQLQLMTNHVVPVVPSNFHLTRFHTASRIDIIERLVRLIELHIRSASHIGSPIFSGKCHSTWIINWLLFYRFSLR